MYVKVILNIKVKKQASPQWMAVAVGICVQTYLETNLNISILGVCFFWSYLLTPKILSRILLDTKSQKSSKWHEK